jgi:malate dehydrogenase (oxaloacetate-decarboxylating)
MPAFLCVSSKKFGLVGIVPPVVQTIDLQAAQAYANMTRRNSVKEKRHYLMNLFGRNRTLFYCLFS